MKLESAPAGRTRPAGRGPEVRAAILAATLAELTEKGYAALTVDNVARRSGVHKTTIYRRWKDREALVAEAFTNLLATKGAPIAGTGDIDADLRDLARSLVRWLTSPIGGSLSTTSSGQSRSSPPPSPAANFPPPPIQANWSEPLSHQSTCGS
jgi:AcrR family transcriptional regulator